MFILCDLLRPILTQQLYGLTPLYVEGTFLRFAEVQIYLLILVFGVATSHCGVHQNRRLYHRRSSRPLTTTVPLGCK